MAIIALFHAEVAVIIPGWWSPSDGLRTSPWNGKELHASTVVWPFYHANGNRNIATQEPFSDQIEPTRAPKTRVFSSICWKSERQKKKKLEATIIISHFSCFALQLSICHCVADTPQKIVDTRRTRHHRRTSEDHLNNSENHRRAASGATPDPVNESETAGRV